MAMPVPGRISEAVKLLIARRLESPEFVDVLLLLREGRTRRWKADEIGAALGLDGVSVSRALVALRQAGILKVELADDLEYSYQPLPHVAETIDELAAHYKEYPQEIVELIAARPRQKLRLLADAFRFRKDE